MLEDFPTSIGLHCPFCFSTNFEMEDGQEFQDGDLVTCANCGKECDYTAMVSVAKENATEMVKERVTDEIKNMFKKSGWKVK